MPTLIRWRGERAELAEDPFTAVDDDAQPPPGDVIVSMARFEREGERLLSQGRSVGVRVEADQAVEDLAYDLPRLAVVALVFPKFRQGQAYTSARLLRERFGFKGEIRAVGDVLREQARFMVRCGFDAFEPADGSTPEQWTHVAARFRHVYQRAADAREPAYVERLSSPSGGNQSPEGRRGSTSEGVASGYGARQS